QWVGLTVWTQHPRYLLGRVLGVESFQRNDHAYQFVLAALVQVRNDRRGDQIVEHVVGEAYRHQKFLAAQQHVSPRQQVPVEHVERFGNRECPLVVIAEGALGRISQIEGQLGPLR